jgi:hypothetical protein
MIGTWTNSVENDAPTGSGFRKSLKALCTTANASPSASASTRITMRIEGQDVQRIAKGTSDAQKLALSFWVKANVTGTYIAELFDSDNSRQVSAAYTIDSSGTWEKKTIVFPEDITGVFDNDNNGSLGVFFWLAVGSNYSSGTLNTSWAASVDANRVVGQTNLAAATSNYWQVTGVQLEAGPVATPFEFEPFETTFRKCQRYYERGTSRIRRQNNDTLRSSSEAIEYKVTKRSNTVSVSNINSATTNVTVCDFYSNDDSSGFISWTASSGIDFQATVSWTASAEL